MQALCLFSVMFVGVQFIIYLNTNCSKKVLVDRHYNRRHVSILMSISLLVSFQQWHHSMMEPWSCHPLVCIHSHLPPAAQDQFQGLRLLWHQAQLEWIAVTAHCKKIHITMINRSVLDEKSTYIIQQFQSSAMKHLNRYPRMLMYTHKHTQLIYVPLRELLQQQKQQTKVDNYNLPCSIHKGGHVNKTCSLSISVNLLTTDFTNK